MMKTDFERSQREPGQQFISLEALGGIVLLLCSVVALAVSNSSYADAFAAFWKTVIGLSIGNISVEHSLHHWINDGLMAIFFFVIGLEIKREIVIGELSTRKKVLLPVIAAFGGAIVPSGIYLAFNFNGDGMPGWGIPMATDIAFVLGIITLLGKKVPSSIKIFVLAFAIIDDLIAIAVIAIFYTSQLNLSALGLGAGIIAAALLLKSFGRYHALFFLFMGIFAWFCFLESGVHPTLAGVAMAFAIPSTKKISRNEYTEAVSMLLAKYGSIEGSSKEDQGLRREIISEIEYLTASTESPMQRMEHLLHPATSFFIMPVFALANAGIQVSAEMFDSLLHPVSVGIVLGLLAGKTLGISLSIWLSVKSGIALLPTGASFRHIIAMSCLGGMGFTMSLFISVLAFREGELLAYAKFGVLAGSLLSALTGSAVFIFSQKQSV